MATQPPPIPPHEGGMGGPSAPQYGPSQQGWVAGQPQSASGWPSAPPVGGDQFQGGPSGPRAGFWRRFGASLLDGILVGIVVVVLSLLLHGVGYALGILIGIAYFTYFEGGPRGQTPGKSALGIRVVSFETGGSIGYGRALIRYLGSIVSGIAIYIGYLWMLWDPEKQCWHDKFSGAVVVPVAAYPPPR